MGTGTLVMELGDASAPGVSYDVLDVSGQLVLGAFSMLEIRLLPGFDAGGGSGQGLDFQRDGGRFGLHLAPAVPEPASALLMLLGGLFLRARRRKARGG